MRALLRLVRRWFARRPAFGWILMEPGSGRVARGIFSTDEKARDFAAALRGTMIGAPEDFELLPVSLTLDPPWPAPRLCRFCGHTAAAHRRRVPEDLEVVEVDIAEDNERLDCKAGETFRYNERVPRLVCRVKGCSCCTQRKRTQTNCVLVVPDPEQQFSGSRPTVSIGSVPMRSPGP